MADGMNQPGDEWSRLMSAALAGDDAAYRQVLGDMASAFRKDVRNRLKRFGRGNADGEDIVQEALLAVHLKRDTWDRTRPLAPWAFAVLSYKFTDRMRQGRGRTYVTVDDAGEIADAAPEASVSLDAERMLQALAPQHRRIVTAMSIEGRSAADVALETGSTEGAVRVALHRALKRLTTLYRENPE